MYTDISVLIAGRAGDGVLFTGNILAKIMKRQGWDVVTIRDFPSNIRGENTNYSIRASLKTIHGRGDSVDVLLAFTCDAVYEHVGKVAQGGIVLCDDGRRLDLSDEESRGKVFHKFFLRKLARENFKNEIFKNMIALGALSYILGLDFRAIERIIAETFLKRKGRDIVRKNVQAITLGCERAKKIISPEHKHELRRKKDVRRLLISGDEAIALGTLAAGCRFFSAYPICPASEIWQWLAVHLPRFNGIVVQTEDELAAVNMALGASYAGVRAMTATSGPGASLMMEGFGLAGMAEIPLVIVNVQRVGPATGLPTKTEQSDLDQWVHGSHGEFPRIILSPGTVEECFDFTVKAFNLAEKYQCPVVLLTEQDYGQNLRTVRRFNLFGVKIDRGKLLSQEKLLRMKDYKRYRFIRDGISPRAIPSMKNGLHMVEGNEHDEKGYRDECVQNRIRMMEKRMKKLKSAAKDLADAKVWGDADAETGIVGFGSTLGPILEAVSQLERKRIKAKYFQVRTLWPFLYEQLQDFAASCRRIIVVENNYTGQLRRLIQSQGRIKNEIVSILNYSSQPFSPGDISSRIQKNL
jgi:2-oxoglutarate ferredoxin oxidoreductase subunit alpha